jgi:hypothetical protein
LHGINDMKKENNEREEEEENIKLYIIYLDYDK